MEVSSDQGRYDYWRTVALTVALLGLLIGISEGIARTEFVQTRLVAPSLGIRHFEFGQKYTQLERITRTDGPIDCLIIGSSMADLGIDPEVITSTIKAKTGEDLRCFNFAIDGLPAAGAGGIVQILTKMYEPKLIIYGTDARDYAVPMQAEDTQVILESNWFRYQQGSFNLDGWLQQHSYLYRYHHQFSQLLRFKFEDVLNTANNSRITKFGFTPIKQIGSLVNIPPNPNDDSYQLKYYYSLLSDYQMRPENISGLDQVLKFQDGRIQVVVVEMPVPETYFYFFGNGVQDYQEFIDRVRSETKSRGIPFWQTTHLHLIPDTGWVDYSHLNQSGARIFSEWLGGHLARLYSRDFSAITDSPYQ